MSNSSVQVTWNTGAITNIENKTIKGMLRMGYDMANMARGNAPYQTGALSNSIRVEEDAGDVLVIAGGKSGAKDIRYAAIQEFGGRAGGNHSARIQGKHYMQRAKDYIMTGNYIQKYFGDIT